MDGNVLLGAMVGLTALYFYLKQQERKKPIPLNNYDKELNEILDKEEYKVKGRFE